MTNFFLEELRKIYGDGRVIHDPQFVGECCYGSLGDLRVKARFTKQIRTFAILNRTSGLMEKRRSGMLAAPVRVIIRCWQTRLRNISAFLN